MRRTLAGLTLGALLALAGLMSAAAAGEKASGTLVNGAGADIGTVRIEQGVDGLTVFVTARGLAPGAHGIHLHAVGACAGPDFTTAGGHFNPTSKQHGLKNPQGPHAGDLENLTAAADGSATYRGFTNLATLSPGSASLFDADGAALVIHAGPDDHVTDPAGNSGARVACAVLKLDAATPTPALPRTGAGGAAGLPDVLAVAVALGSLSALAVASRRRRG